ncbi:winged helix-turn-helix transcriptional regulator [Streptomyces sp. NPDC088261]|uniref:winged helix-turn-helix transcriptional regulator n=1 Tax=Streptomyces sp. NPDC088261 TaxID=3365851 RepID=UPI0037F298E2
MKRRNFGQYCGLARALELVGERWALLIIRDLAVRPQRYTDLLEGLPGIPTNVLSTRLKELEQAGLVERRVAPAPERGVRYVLTPEGSALEPAVHALGRWGTKHLEEPRPGDVVTPESVTMSLRAGFNPAAATGLNESWEIHADDMVLHAVVTDGRLAAGVGPVPGEADLVITLTAEGLPSSQALLRAARCGLVELEGRRALLNTFVNVFTRPVDQNAPHD